MRAICWSAGISPILGKHGVQVILGPMIKAFTPGNPDSVNGLDAAFCQPWALTVPYKSAFRRSLMILIGNSHPAFTEVELHESCACGRESGFCVSTDNRVDSLS
jgi:hypothetical protein